ncbi:MAG: phosphoglycerate kinase, partial [Nitrospirae bacterium]|nr:phosphoglycerate kinase [Nitrospirota bacterium]
FKALGLEIGNSLVEPSMLDFARAVREKARERGVKFYLPVDCVIATSREPGAETKIVPIQEIPQGWIGLDIGPASVRLFTEALANAKTILWNGPMGVGGADTALAVDRAHESENITFLSTGGGAALQLLEGRPLPGLEVLPDNGEAR